MSDLTVMQGVVLNPKILLPGSFKQRIFVSARCPPDRSTEAFHDPHGNIARDGARWRTRWQRRGGRPALRASVRLCLRPESRECPRLTGTRHGSRSQSLGSTPRDSRQVAACRYTPVQSSTTLPDLPDSIASNPATKSWTTNR